MAIDTKLEVRTVRLDCLHPNPWNPNRMTAALRAKLRREMERQGYMLPIIVRPTGKDTYEIIDGEQRWDELRAAGVEEADVVVRDLDDTEARIATVNLNELHGEWDRDGLQQLLRDLEQDVSMDELAKRLPWDPQTLGKLAHRRQAPVFDYGGLRRDYIVPPFSVLDGRHPQWTQRKRQWWATLGREEAAETRPTPMDVGMDEAYGKTPDPYRDGKGWRTSVFDPVLAEVLLFWFCHPGGRVLDPFAGGPVRGVVAGKLGFQYTGIEIREEQVEINTEVAAGAGVDVQYIVGDALQAVPKLQWAYDMILTCPPYYDLEVYSKQDLSALGTYDEFMAKLTKVIGECGKLLNEDRFTAMVVGEVRDDEGHYRGFVADVIKAHQKHGLDFYNEAVLLTPIGTSGIRAAGTFKYRKLVKVHQNVLTFVKGDARVAAAWVDEGDA